MLSYIIKVLGMAVFFLIGVNGQNPLSGSQEESSTQNIRDIFQQSIQDSRNEINDIIPKEILTDDFDSIVDNTNEINPAEIFRQVPRSTTTAKTTLGSNFPTSSPPQRFSDESNRIANSFERTTFNRNDNPNRNINRNVDEFGNPLGEITNTDTTRYELGSGGDPYELRCPRNWQRFMQSCYKFTRSPPKKWGDARELCRAFRHDDQDKADLASVDSFEEHRFISDYLNKNDPQHRRWYISTRQENKNQWINQGDGTQMLNLDKFFHPANEWGEFDQGNYKKDYLVYGFSLVSRQWGFQPVFGQEEYLYICEVPIDEVKYLINDDRSAEYGQALGDPRYIPMGPVFLRQPNRTVFDISQRNIVNDVSLLCISQGWPSPSYEWFKEVYINDTLTEVKVEPLKDSRITISGGQLIINNPDQTRDKGTYFCSASNEFGTIRSRTVTISFGFIGEFILRRSNEVGRENWGKAISCDAPHHYPSVKYYWARNYFPNLVEEDRRIMVSHDGYIYFTALENIDRGNYSCNVQSSEFNTGRNGPFFTIDVLPHPNYQQLRFPQNFPKSFPEAPVAGEDVRLECIAFGYPVPHYNWTRANSPLPRGAYMTNYNRVLIIPRVKVQDQGEYICTAKNDKVTIKAPLKLSIQSRPVFTINIGDQYVDENDEIIWTCEAFGIPDVTYAWLRNGKPLITDPDKIAPEDRGRFEARDNVLKIRQVQKERDEGMYQCMAKNDLDKRYSSGQLKVLTLPPSFIKRPLDERIYAAEQGNVTIHCEPEAAPLPNITWYHKGNRLGSGGKIEIYANGNLQITNLNSADDGQYECVATNKYGSARSRTLLIIMAGPTFTAGQKPLPRIVANKGKTIDLRCKALADDKLDRAYHWRLNGILLQFVEDYEKQRILELKNAGSSRISLKRRNREQISFPSLNTRNQHLTNQWMNVGENYKNKGTGDFQKFRRAARDGDMRILNISIAESGTYECGVETAVGTIYATSDVIVHAPPGPPGGVTAVELSSNSGTVVWTDGAFYGYRIDNYRIEGRTDHNQTWIMLADNIAGEDIKYQGQRQEIDGRRQYRLINKLSPWAAYSFRVAGYNILGIGEWSEPSPQYNTMPDKPYQTVTNVRSDGGRTGDLTLRWESLPKQHQNAPGLYYKIYYRRTGIDEERDFQEKTLRGQGNINMYVIRVPSDYYYTKYEVKIQVFNDMCHLPECSGPITDPVEVLTAEHLPFATPTKIGARPYNSTALNITWKEIPSVREKVGGKLIGYRIKYWMQNRDEVIDSQYVLSRSTRPHALIIGLQPNTYYWVKVMAYNSAGPGPESERFLERTYKLRPQKPPTAVQVFGINPSTIRVTWRFISPSIREEPLAGYKVRVWESDKDVSEANDTVIYIGSRLEATISSLYPGKTYFLRVLAFSQGGEGKMSSPRWEFQMGDPKYLNEGNSMMVKSLPAFLLTLLTIHLMLSS